MRGTSRAFEVLYRHLLSQATVDTRIAAILRLLEQAQDERFPFIGLFDQRVSQMRHILAHNTMNIYESTDEVIVFESRRRGQDHVHKLKLRELEYVEAVIWHASGDLWQLGDRLYSDWREAHGPLTAFESSS